MRNAFAALLFASVLATSPALAQSHRTSSSARAPSAPTSALVQQACGGATAIASGQIVRGRTTGGADHFRASCADGASSPDVAYRLRITAPSHVTLQLEADYDAALYVRSHCEDAATEVACNDDAVDTNHSLVDTELEPGDYTVIVDGYRFQNAGAFTLRVDVTPVGTPNASMVTAASSSTAPEASAAPATSPSSNQLLFTGPALTPGDGRSDGVHGRVVYAKRVLTPRGLSAYTVDRAAPHFRIEALAQDGTVVATGETDDEGRFSLPLPRNTIARVRCVSRTSYLGNDLRVVDAPMSDHLYEVSSDFFTVRGGDTVNLRADVGGDEPAGAFNILTGFVRMLPFVQRGFGHALPPLYAFWRRGNNASLPVGSITAYIRQYRAHQGAFALQVMGGDPGREDASDSDQFDDPIVLHEFTHFVIDQMVGNFSNGGPHSWGELHIPGLALNESVASVVAAAVIGDGRYWDTVGVEPHGHVTVDVDQESMTETVRGVGSEATDQMIQWDLVDGAEGIADRDNDGIAIGLSGLFRLYASFHDDADAFPDVATVLDRGVQLGLFTREQANQLPNRPEPQGFSMPPSGLDVYPIDLALPGTASGKIDGETQPAPSGGRNIPFNGFDANRFYRVHVTEPRTLDVRLHIDGEGTQESGTDLDLAVLGRNMDVVGISAGTGRLEAVRVQVTPGTYVIWVRDGDQSPSSTEVGTNGNRANYTLEVR